MIGRLIGNYRIAGPIAEGGMGSVYLATHPAIGKRVAVKVLHPHLCEDATQVSRFFQEARAVNEIGHPNIVDITDFGKTEDGLVYLIMEYLDGPTLRDVLIDDGPLPVARAIGIGRQIASALAAAHRVGVIHRDVKPGNVVLVAGDPELGGERVKLLDFGVAKLVDPRFSPAHKTDAGAMLGTLFYMAPEQILSHPVDGRTDVHGLGLLLYEVLTGVRPFEADQTLITMARVARETPEPPRRLRPEIPEWLDALVMRCLEKLPARRPQEMSEVVRELADAVTPPPEARLTASRAVEAPRVALPAEGRPPATVAEPVRRTGVARVAEPSDHGEPARSVRPGLWAAVIAAGAVVGVSLALLASRPEPGRPASAPPPRPMAELTIDSTPAGARVTRLYDAHVLGTTPVRDGQRVDGSRVEYLLQLEGHADARVPFRFEEAGAHRLHVPLQPLEAAVAAPPPPARPAKAARAPAPRTKKTRAPPPARARPASAPVPTAAPASPPAAEPPTGGFEQLPPLLPSVRVKRIGAR